MIHVWELARFDQAGQMTFYNPDPNDAAYGAPVSSADLNNDGRAEFILSAMAADGPDGDFRTNAGEIHIYFSDGTLGGEIDFKKPSSRVVTIYGEAEDDIFGIKHTAGDMEGDGVMDLLVGAFYGDAPGLKDAGKLYIFSSDLLADLLRRGDDLDLKQPLPAGVRTITGPGIRNRLGVWVDTGDINGDGFDDVVVAADMADGFNPNHNETGRVYIFGPRYSAFSQRYHSRDDNYIRYR
jgi:hypothetical protein